MIKKLPKEERPRERLVRHGPESMSTVELLAIILGSGTKGKSVLDLAREILILFPKLTDTTVHELCRVKGLGMAKAVQLKAALTLASRVERQTDEERSRVASAQQAYTLVRSRVEDEKKELFGAILLDVRSVLIRWEIISVGTLDKTFVHPREVFSPAIRHGAARMILFHNHPSGDVTPSPQDYAVTEKLLEASRLIKIPIEDHLVVSSVGYFSMREDDKTTLIFGV
ncbi:MAG: hypothetical protein K940chlam2_01514 [Chlamydiae bacterium]|nr:hypothetical protein [Chlamydiota bacterium]